MIDILSQYLTENTTPELRDSIARAHRALDRIELPHYENEFEELIMTHDSVEQGEVVPNIVATTNRLQHFVMSGHGVALSDSTPTDILTICIDGIRMFPQYSDHASILQTIAMDMVPEEMFCELLELVTSISVEETLPYMESVDPMMFVRLRELVTPKEVFELSEEETILKQRHVNVIRQFIGYVQPEVLDTANAVANGLGIGYLFSVYADLIGRNLETMSIDKAARELCAMAFISGDGINNPRGVIKNNIDNMISDPDMITRVDIKVSELLLGFKP